MKILYVAEMDVGTSSSWRYRALVDLGHQVTPIDMIPPEVRRREANPLYRIARRLVGPFDISGLNDTILRHVKQESYDVLWLNKCLTVTEGTLRAAKKLQPQCRIVGYAMDDMYGRHNQSRQFLQHLPWYDIFFTTKTYNVAELRSLGCRRVEFTGNAFDVHSQRPLELTEEDRREYGADVGFVGTFEAERGRQVNYLAENGVPVQVRGDQWERRSDLHPSVVVRSKSIYGEPYTKAICGAKINLCFLRKINRDLQTQRSIEIPACGAFMLAERTNEHLKLFEEGKEAEFFSSNDELLEEVRYYLAHPEERQQIAAAGRERCLRSGYSYHDRLRTILAQIGQLDQQRCAC